MTRTLQNQREVIFYLLQPLTPRTGPQQTIPQPRGQRTGLVPGVDWRRVVTGQIEAWIST